MATMADTAKVFNMSLAMMCGIKAEKEILRDGSYYSLSTGILPSLGARSNRRVKLRRAWEIFLIVLVVYSAWVSPFEFGFLGHAKGTLALVDNIRDTIQAATGTDSEGLQQQETLDALPKAIRSSITHYLFYSLVQSVYLFHGISNDLLFQLVSEMKAEYYPPREDVIMQNKAPTDFYILVTSTTVKESFHLRILFFHIT
ncbi:hypothetical protein ZIOFF_002453 [Zingiber officinale]|uniref:Cyclic nucleotide-binding domain-containing protein n=1 Tax=Zingiber officinale TaxID=94328 RepID=A0A8J5ILN2_ZINOF|nr:hypothetical protein ZIOFF_002453 [Zingiber officinale]